MSIMVYFEASQSSNVIVRMVKKLFKEPTTFIALSVPLERTFCTLNCFTQQKLMTVLILSGR